VAGVLSSYESYEFHKVYHQLYGFCVVDLSSMYFDILKDRLYTWPKRSVGRRAAQTVLHETLDALVKLLAPVLSFTAEEAYQLKPGAKQESVFFEEMPRPHPERQDDALEAELDTLIRVRETVLKRLEADRQAKTIGSGLEAKVLIACDNDQCRRLLNKYEPELAAFFIVSQVEFVAREALSPKAVFDEKLGIGVDSVPAEGTKCRRCWMYSPDVGKTDEHPDLCGKCVSALEV
jgi:isoleucyl-tRNA synthetase